MCVKHQILVGGEKNVLIKHLAVSRKVDAGLLKKSENLNLDTILNNEALHFFAQHVTI